jgi:hypothetical protein
MTVVLEAGPREEGSVRIGHRRRFREHGKIPLRIKVEALRDD